MQKNTPKNRHFEQNNNEYKDKNNHFTTNITVHRCEGAFFGSFQIK